MIIALIAGNSLESYYHSVEMKYIQARWSEKHKNWTISSEAPNRRTFIDYYVDQVIEMGGAQNG